VYWGFWDGRTASVERFDSRTRCLVDVRPNGSQYLTTPHAAGDLAVHRFPTGEVVASRPAEATFPEADEFDLVAGYVTNDIILAGSVETKTHVALSAGDLSPLGEVDYPAGSAKDMILPSGAGRWLTSDALAGRLQLWAFA
jgi:hypothetical protein